MIALDGVRDEGNADLVDRAMPAGSLKVAAELNGLVDFGVGIGFMLAFVPSKAAEDAEVFGDLLLVIPGEAIFHGAEVGVMGDFGRRIGAVEVVVDGFAIGSHVRVVDEAEDTGDAFATAQE